MSDLKNIRVRFAPSPTGALHIGGVRTALYNYLFAKKNNGKIILRIEDTDSKRFVKGAEEYIVNALDWLGIEIDEGIGKNDNQGPYAPYRQSERKEIYKKYCNDLLDKDKAYIAFDTPEQLDEKRKEIKNFQYDSSIRETMSNSLTLTKEEVENRIKNGDTYVIRFKVTPNEDITIDDIIRGKVTINSSVLDDKVLYKSADQLPTYHLANIVDDHLMKISHVIRGEEWLPSAPLHVLLYKAFGWEDTMPQFAHLPLLLKPEGNGKLSKRDGDRLGFPVFPCDWTDPKTGEKSSGYREAGYFPEAVINFLALLGWHPGTNQEMFSMDELIQQFDLSKCSKAGAKFDFEKGKWFNHQYLESKSNEELQKLFMPILEEHNISKDSNYIQKVISLVKERATFVNDIWDQSSFFFVRPTTYTAKKMKKFWKEETPSIMKELIEQLELLPDLETKNTEEKICAWIEEKGYKMGLVLNGFRMSLVGEGKGPHIFDISEMLGKQETILRINKAIENIKLA